MTTIDELEARVDVLAQRTQVSWTPSSASAADPSIS